MNIIEKSFYTIIIFFISYILIAVFFRYITDSYTAHMIAGISATIIATICFMYFILKNK